MKNFRDIATLCFLGLLTLGGCAKQQREMDTLQPSQILISQVQAGAGGNNNHEFIELYNYGGELVDLQGWSLVYRLPASEDDLPVLTWEESAFIPPFGYFLLVRRGQDFGVIPDAFFDQAMNNSGGGLGLLNPDGQLVDALAWGNAPDRFTEGTAAPAMVDDQSLMRRKGDAPGEMLDSDVNVSDFSFNPEPEPRNVIHVEASTHQHLLKLEVSSSEEVQPGSAFNYTITATNQGEARIESLIVNIPILQSLEGVQLSPGWRKEAAFALWPIDQLEPGETVTDQIRVQAPWIYGTLTLQNAHILVESTGDITLAPVLRTEVAGGVLPIRIARTLIGQDVIVEGFATMYTGGFFAGSSGTKFYLEDGSAGVQIYVPNGMGVLDVPIGARVRVEGEAQLYRGALEIVPSTPELVEILEAETGENPSPLQTTIRHVVNDLETTPGLLVEIEGTLVRAEEFSYSYELDFVDDEGQLLTAYLDKETDATIETLTEGEVYRAVGVMEIRDGNNLLNPRQQSDLIRVFQPIVYIDADAPGAVAPGNEFTVTLSLENHSGQPLTDFLVWAEAPSTEFTILEIMDQGQLEAGLIRWPVPALPPQAGKVEVRFRLRMPPAADYYALQSYGVELPSGVESSSQQPLRVFNGGIVPIWAIQGNTEQSPYRLDHVETTGVVTGVFPELQGFWIQDRSGDDDPTTSEGLFIFTGELQVEIDLGDSVQISGVVREISAQTQLYVSSADQIQVLAQSNPLPTPISLDPPADLEAARAYYEALEGMFVAVDQPATVVGPTSRYGETFMLLAKHGLDRVMRGDEMGYMIVVDDGSAATHYDQSTMTIALAVGDRLEYISGPLAYTYGAYKIQPLESPQIRVVDHPLPTLGTVDAPDFNVMTWNVENLFDILEPHPSDPPRPRRAEYDLSLTKVANTILAAGAPTLIGLQEVENLKIMQDIAEHELLVPYGYTAVLIEGTDSRGIDVGYLVRTDHGEILDYSQWPAPEGLTSRPPLLIHLRLVNGFEFYVLNNHFTSLAGGEQATEPRRNEQALWNVHIMREVEANDPGAHFIVLGDLNSFIDSLPIQSLQNAGLKHIFDIDPDQIWYSYVYQGVTQTLDHMLVSQGLFNMLGDSVVLHTNADFPLPPADDASPLHKSDHDPVIAIFAP